MFTSKIRLERADYNEDEPKTESERSWLPTMGWKEP